MQCAGSVLSCRTTVKYVGVELDQSLAGDCIVDKIISKLNSKLKFLYRQTWDVSLEKKNANCCINPMPLWLYQLIMVFWTDQKLQS